MRILAAIITCFSLCIFAYTAQAKEILRIGVTQYPSTLHPMIDAMLAKTYVNAMVRRPLTIHDPDWQPICMLCTEIPSFENGRAKRVTLDDGTETVTARYTLQDNAKWGDGTPVTSADVIFSWTVGKHPLVGVSNFELYSKDIIDVKAIDEKTFEITFDKETCDFALINDFNIIPAHLEKSVFEADPAQYKNTSHFDADPTNAALFYGPYKITNVRAGQGFTLEKNPTWWGKAPQFEQIIVTTIENSGALTAQLLSGQIDMIAGELGLTLDQALSFEKRIKRQKPNAFTFTYKPSLVYEHIDINHDNPHLSDARVRQALLYAINREAISAQLFEGKQPVAHSNITSLDSTFNTDVKTYPHDPAKAAQLLDAAGWTLGEDGMRRNAAGETLSLTQMTTAGNKSRELVQQAIQSDWKKIGVESRIENQTPRVFFGQTTRERKYEDTAMYAWLSSPQNIPRTTLHSTMIPTEENSYAGQNYIGYKNTRMDQILDDLETTCDEPANSTLWHELQNIYAQDLPALPLYFRSEVHVIPNWMTGVQPTGHQYPTTFWIENWGGE